MVFQIECSDEKGEHVELLAGGTARLFGRDKYDDENGAFVVSERQLSILLAMLEARAKLREVLK